ncbi:MAG: hypothetical protein DRJ03_00900 [Chloroflexi bacterium]|nr:MAG: hypothetical protein DRJ03_00900 [Chloroflexota bacterium]
MARHKKIAILTNMMEFNPGYSLTGIIKDQARMLVKYGHEVHLFVNEQYHGEEFSEDVILHKKIPFTHLTDYRTRNELSTEHKQIINTTAVVLQKELVDFDIAFTHDFIFTGWFLPYGMGLQQASTKLPNVRWLHWIHSVPSIMSDWWLIKEYGPKHKIVFPNSTERLRVAEQYRGEIADIRIIPHIKDLRTFWDFHEDTCKFLDLHPNLMQSQVVQIYPASSDRLHAKNVDKVIQVFANIKKLGVTCCLVIANQWATGKQPKQNIEEFKEIARKNGLICTGNPNDEFIFTSEWCAEYENGIPTRILRELMLLQNLFVFPTREESFGLVGPEAALSSACLLVLNKSLAMMTEVHGNNGLYFDFGSFHHQWRCNDEVKYYHDLAFIILGRLRENEAIVSNVHHRLRHNWDYLYHTYYGPIMQESELW